MLGPLGEPPGATSGTRVCVHILPPRVSGQWTGLYSHQWFSLLSGPLCPSRCPFHDTLASPSSPQALVFSSGFFASSARLTVSYSSTALIISPGLYVRSHLPLPPEVGSLPHPRLPHLFPLGFHARSFPGAEKVVAGAGLPASWLTVQVPQWCCPRHHSHRLVR